MTRRLAAILACAFAAVLFAAPAPAWAVDHNGISVNGVDIVADEDHVVECGDGTAVYNPETGVLTLTNAVITEGTGYPTTLCGIESGRDMSLNIVLVGENTISLPMSATGDGSAVPESGAAGSITISGSGSLEIASTQVAPSAINASYGCVTIDDGARVTARSEGSNAIAAQNIIVKGGATVKAEVDAEDPNRFALFSGSSISIEGGSTVTTSGGCYGMTGISVKDGSTLDGTAAGSAYAVLSYGPITVTDSTLNATSAENVAVYAYGNDTLTLTDSTVEVTSTDYYALYAETGGIKMSGGTVTLSAPNGYASYTDGNLLAEDGAEINVTSQNGLGARLGIKLSGAIGTIDAESAALNSKSSVVIEQGCDFELSGKKTIQAKEDDVSISGSRLDISGTDAVRAGNDISIENSDLIITATESPLYAAEGSITISGDDTQTVVRGGDHISAGGEVIVSGGTVDVTVTASPSDSSVEAIYGADAVRISGGTVNAVASKGEGSAEAYALGSRGEIALTGGVITLRGDAGAIDLHDSGLLDFGGRDWCQWATSVAGSVTEDAIESYDPAERSDTYLRIEPVGTTYQLSVVGGEGTDSYVAGTQATVSADAFNAGGHFSCWTVNDPTGAGVLANSTAAKTTLTMPAGAVELTATYEPHVLERVAAVDPSCTDAGVDGHWKCVECGALFSDAAGTTLVDADEFTIPSTGHSWGEPAWSWDDGYTKFVATFTCSNDPSHTEVLTAEPTASVKVEPTCAEAGVRVYTATVELDGTKYTATSEQAIPALGHDFKDGVCTVCEAKDPDYVAPEEDKSALPATGDVSTFFSLAPALAGASALTAGIIARRRR